MPRRNGNNKSKNKTKIKRFHRMPAFMRIFIVILFQFLATLAIGQHSDTLRMRHNTVFLVSYDDARIIKEGDSLLDAGMIQKAIEKYSMVVELSPMNLKAISNRAFAYLQLDDYSKSLNDYNVAMGIDSTNYVNLSNRALVKFYLKKYTDGLSDCDKALKYNPNYAYAYFHKGLCEYELDNLKEAVNCFTGAVKSDSTFTRAFYNRGNTKFTLNDLPGACADWEKAKKLGHKMADSMLDKYCK